MSACSTSSTLSLLHLVQPSPWVHLLDCTGTGYAGHDQEKLLTVRVLPKAIV
jgi:hypothetical protein